MPLVECPDCKKMVSDRAPQCVHCGCPTDVSPVSQPNTVLLPTPIDYFSTIKTHGMQVDHPPVPQAPVEPDHACPSCHSDSIQSIKVIWESGHAQTSGTTFGSSIGSVWPNGKPTMLSGVTIGSSQGSITSDLAARFKPPVAPVFAGSISCLALCGLLGVICFGTVGVLGTLVAMGNGKGDAAAFCFFLISLPAVGLFLLMKKRNTATIKRLREEHAIEYKEYQRLYDDYCATWFCHKCGFVFYLR